MPVLTHQQARKLYDRFGSRQDGQGFYEDVACADLIAHCGFDEAHAVFEFGCGTGRFAEGLLVDHLPVDSRYVGVDISSTMVDLSRRRLGSWSARVDVHQSDGPPRLPDEDNGYDRFVCNYVLDLLSEEDIGTLLAEAHRILRRGGRLGLISLTYGNSGPSWWVSCMWHVVHALRPQLLGGCRPLRLRRLLPEAEWKVEFRNVVRRWGICSEVLIASAR